MEIDKPFTGFSDPTQNWSRLPHQLIGALPLIGSLAEMKVILYVLRHTWGFSDEDKRISVDEFQHGRKHSWRWKKNHPDEPDRLDDGTGMSAPAIRRGIKAAIEHGFLAVEVDDSDKARIKKYYRLVESNSEGTKRSPTPEDYSKIVTPTDTNCAPQGNETLPQSKKEPIEKTLEKKDPPLADSSLDEPWPADRPPTKGHEPRTAAQVKAGVRKAIATFAKNGPGRAGVADPTHESDPWVDVTVREWCKIAAKDFEKMSKGTKLKLAGIFQKVGAVCESGPVPIGAAICRFPDEHEFWRDKVGFEWPTDRFCDKLGMMLQPDAEPEPIDLDNPTGDRRPITL